MARTLLQGLPVQFEELPRDAAGFRELRRIGARYGLLLRSSFRSSCELRLAAPNLVGFKAQARSMLLWRAMKRPQGVHKAVEYLRLAQFARAHILRRPLPETWIEEARPSFTPTPAAVAAARRRLGAAGIRTPYVVCCATASTRHSATYKVWPGFPELYRRLDESGIDSVSCPGPGELARLLETSRPRGAVFDDVGLPELAALIAASAVTVSIDTGVMHLAAATGVRTLAVFGDTCPTRYYPLSACGEVLGDLGAWPDVDTVWRRVQHALSRCRN
jgi:ADP-heptose:LPS heptosyltransferase